MFSQSIFVERNFIEFQWFKIINTMTIMKKAFLKSWLFLALAFTAAIFTSCDKNNETQLDISVSSLTVPATGDKYSVTIETNVEWTASSSESWCVITPTKGSGKGSITISVAKNTGAERTASISINANGEKKTISIIQLSAEAVSGKITMTVDSDKIQFWLAAQSATIHWGDENSDLCSGNTEQVYSHTYSTAGSYDIVIEGIGITSLYTNYAKLTDLDVSENPALISLGCSGNNFTDLDVSRNEALDTLKCTWNKLTNLNVKYNTALRYLDCSYNDITNLDLTKNTSLEYINIRNNDLSTFDLSKNLQLLQLDISDNQNLTSIDLSNNTALEFLAIYLGAMTTIDISHNRALKQLYVQNGKLTSLNLSQNTELIGLTCDENNLGSLDLSNNPNLIRVWCRSSNLSNITLSNGNEQLAEFVCGFNPLSAEVINAMFEALPDVTGKEYSGELELTPGGTYNFHIGGTDGVATANRSIAENKGWTVSGD